MAIVYTPEEATEMLKGKDSKHFRGAATYFGLIAAKEIQERNINIEVEKIINIYTKHFFDLQKEKGAMKRVKPSLKKDFQVFFKFGWSEWMAGRGREHV